MVTSAGLTDITPPPSWAVTRSFTLAAPRSVRGEARVSVPAGGGGGKLEYLIQSHDGAPASDRRVAESFRISAPSLLSGDQANRITGT